MDGFSCFIRLSELKTAFSSGDLLSLRELTIVSGNFTFSTGPLNCVVPNGPVPDPVLCCGVPRGSVPSPLLLLSRTPRLGPSTPSTLWSTF